MDIFKLAEDFAKKEYLKNDPMHQWEHIEAVRKRAMEIASQLNNVDYELLHLSITFHDIDYHSDSTFEKNYNNHVDNSIKVAEKFLKEQNFPKERIDKVKQIMMDHSTPHRKKFGESKIIEGKILYDADKSIFITTIKRYDKYFPFLYLDETRNLVKRPLN